MNEVEHFGQVVTDSVKAKAQTGMAKNKKIRMMIIRSENFFLFMTQAHPFPPSNLAFPVPKKKKKRKG